MKRWIIRSFFIGLLLLCVGGWIASYVRLARVSYMGEGLWTLESVNGQVALMRWPDYREKYNWQNDKPTWRCFSTISSGELHSELGDYREDWYFLGFGFLWNDPYQPGRWAGGIPFWFLTTLSAVALFFSWKKTARRKLGGTFPVEVGRQHD